LGHRCSTIRAEHRINLCMVSKVMNLQQIHVPRAKTLQRTLELPPGSVPITRLNLGRQEHPIASIRRYLTIVQLGVLIEGCRVEVVHPELKGTGNNSDSGVRAPIEC